MAHVNRFHVKACGTSMINGELFHVQGEGSGSVEDGTVSLDWRLSAVPQGFSIYGMVLSTSSATSQAFAVERKGGSNLMTLSRGNYRLYRCFDYGCYGSYDFNYEIRTSGDEVTSIGLSYGNLVLPEIKGATMSLVELMCPAGPRKMNSCMHAVLFAKDGAEIPVSVVGYYTPLCEDDEDWTRNAEAQIRRSFVEEVKGEGTKGTISLRYATVIEKVCVPEFPETSAFAACRQKQRASD